MMEALARNGFPVEAFTGTVLGMFLLLSVATFWHRL
jgi:hypothetical protein